MIPARATLLSVLLATVAAADETSLTIYSSADPAGFNPQQFLSQQRGGFDSTNVWNVPGFGIVKQVRLIPLSKGLNTVPFTDVAAFLDPTTVNFTDLTDGRTNVLEQAFKFDLVSPAKLMQRYLDKPVVLSIPAGDAMTTIHGTLLSATQGQLVIDTPAGLKIVPAAGSSIQLGDLPDGFLTKPTLEWLLNAKKGGDHEIRTTYQTGGLTWRADYNLILNEDDTRADLTAWVSILNVSGKGYTDTKLKLIAGDVQRIAPRRPVRMEMARGMVAMEDSLGGGFEEKSFFEYHLYSLPRKTSIASNSTQQLTLFPAVSGLNVQKELLYTPSNSMGWGREPYMDENFFPASGKKIEVFVSFDNKEANKLGAPLPKGRIRSFKEDSADGTLEFIGEALIDHTARNETIRIKLGNAFDVIGERTRVDFSINKAGRTMQETIRLQVRNQKNAAQRVVIHENLYRWRIWTMTKTSAPFSKLNANTITWAVDVPAEGSREIEYTVTYAW
jgi:hypothetical protein